MKKISKIISLIYAFIFSSIIFVQSACADLVSPGQHGGGGGGGGGPHFPSPREEFISYGVTGGVIILTIIVSMVVLIKIRIKIKKRNVNK